MTRLDPQCWRLDAEGEARNLRADLETLLDEGEITAAQFDEAEEFLAELEVSARGLDS